MSNNRFVFTGLEELKAELRALPTELKADGTEIVMGAATRAKAAVSAVYTAHRVSGELAKGLTLEVEGIGPYGTRATVGNRGNLAWLFENGSQTRQYTGTDKIGRVYVNALRGKMPPHHVFIPTMIRHRAQMYAQLAAMLERHGLVVTGHAEAA